MQAVSNAVDSRFAADLAARYIIEREIGRGGSAVVYLARDRKIGRQVALKVLGSVAGAAEAARRFEREIAMVGRLQHPNILALYDSGEAGGALYFAMPYIEGATLRTRLTREGALPPADALRIAAELADALAYAHGAGVVHRDMKPENVLLSGYVGPPRATGDGHGRWHVLVCDFGIARWTERDGALAVADRSGERRLFAQVTRAGHAVGTPAYMAPEQVTGDPSVDRRADVWSLGVVLYEMLTGAPPHADAPTAAEAFRRRLSTPAPSLSTRAGLSASAARALDAVLQRALAPDPAARYASADAFGADVRAAAALLAADQARAGGARRRVRIGTAAAVISAIAIAAGVRGGWFEPGRGGAGVADPALVIVLPFADERTPQASAAQGGGGARTADAAPLLDGRDAEQLLLDAMSRWADLRLVNATRVNDALTRRGIRAPGSLAEAVAIARELGAGRLAW
ncbi:MAG TPA: serine/threonine-protein kinase [Gemmatirosa sp.]